MLANRLTNEGFKSYYFSYPAYDTPTGKIVGLAYLGKSYLVEELVNKHRDDVIERLRKLYATQYKGEVYDEVLVNRAIDILAEEMGVGWFPEGAPNVDPKIASSLYAMDRAYNKKRVDKLLEDGNVIIDRYIYSNMGHQGGKIEDAESRGAFYDWNRKLELEMFGLPEDDIRLFLHVPTIYTGIIKESRDEALDEHERDENHLRNAEKSYLELESRFGFEVIDCLRGMSDPIKLSDVKTPEEIHEEVYDVVSKKLGLR